MADVRAERRGEVAWLTLDQPERLNAYDRKMGDELRQLVDASVDAGVIVITGSGRGFCAGGYLAELADPDPDELRRLFRCSLELFEAIRTSPRPVIAAVNGVAAGGGNELVVACDLAIAAESAVASSAKIALPVPPFDAMASRRAGNFCRVVARFFICLKRAPDYCRSNTPKPSIGGFIWMACITHHSAAAVLEMTGFCVSSSSSWT